MKHTDVKVTGRPIGLSSLGITALCLVTILTLLFWKGWLPGRTVFSNDGPLGAISSKAADLPSGFWGYWNDLNWLGNAGPSAVPDVSQGISLAVGKLMFSRIYAPVGILLLGLSAWLCFREWKYSPLACVLGGLAMALNSDYFSNACWGLPVVPLALAFNFLALAAMADLSGNRGWIRLILAGLAVGMGVMESFDVGAIFSIFTAIFILFQSLNEEGPKAKLALRGVVRVGIVAVFAGFIAAQTVIGLVGTQIQGVAGMEQESKTKQERWDWATQWSLPKTETLNLAIPGLFGYRMDTPGGGNYWGTIGRDPAWDRYFASGKQGQPPGGFIRYGGGGNYAGVLVVLVACWTLAQSLRKQTPYTVQQRRFIWFWSALAFVSLLLAFGRFAPFYQFFYALPYASTIRNPVKFIHIVEWALVILFATGINTLSAFYLTQRTSVASDMPSQWRAWWTKASVFEKRWVKGSLLAVGLALLGWLGYAMNRDKMVSYLQEVHFDAATANALMDFSTRQPGWFLLFLALGAGLIALIMSGYFAGYRARVAGVLLGVLIVADLARANLPWIITYDYQQKYSSNEVIDLLRDKPYEQRVAILPFATPSQLGLFSDLYRIEWAQHHFQFYNIQSLDIVQMSRTPADMEAFEKALTFNPADTNTWFRIVRRWELTNTRYLLGATGFIDLLNKELDSTQQRFRIVKRFDVVPKPGVDRPSKLEELTATFKEDGPYALFDFTGALPRAKLYSSWQVVTNDQTTLEILRDKAFSPQHTLIVAHQIPADQSGATNQVPGTVEFTSYSPKHITLRAKAGADSVLLLNDRFDATWTVAVDGKAAPLLRCNYLMRGVQVPAGEHVVEFRYQPRVTGLYFSIVGVVLGLALLGYLGVTARRADSPAPRNDKVGKAGNTSR